MIRYRPRNFILSRREQRRGGKRKEKKKRKKFRSRMLGLLLIKAIRGFHGVPFSLSLSLDGTRKSREKKKERRKKKRRRRTLRGFERGSPTNYLLRYDLPRLCSCLSRRMGF